MPLLPGCSIASDSKDSFRQLLQAAADMEACQMDTIDHENEDCVSSGSQGLLQRQNAVDQTSNSERSLFFSKGGRRLNRTISSFSDRKPIKKLPHQPASDPCKYVLKNVSAVQESNDNNILEINFNTDAAGPDMSESETDTGQRGRQRIQSNSDVRGSGYSRQNRSESDACLSTDGPNSYPVVEEAIITQQTKYEGSAQTYDANSIANSSPSLRHKPVNSVHDKVDSESGSFMLDKHQISSDVFHEDINLTIDDSLGLAAVEESLRKHGLSGLIFQRFDSLKKIDPISFQYLVAQHLESSKAGKKLFSSSLNIESSSSVVDGEYDPKIREQLERSARCRDYSCQECAEIRNSLKILLDRNIPVQKKGENLLMNMFIHSEICDSLRCPMYWCYSLPKHLSSRQEKLDVIKRQVENRLEDPFLYAVKDFIKIDPNIPACPKEGVDFTILAPLGHSRNTVLVLPTQQDTPEDLKYWVIKKVSFIDDDDTLKELYSQLRDLKNPSIVQHLWAMSFESLDSFVICTAYEGVSLLELVRKEPLQSVHLVVKLMRQLIEVLTCLHQKGILFLNWSASNVIINPANHQLKLADFTCSTLKHQVHRDIGDIAAYLPPHLHPPEILGVEKKELDEKSDIWGLGCLLHEIVTGKPVWFQFQHETLVELQTKMISCKAPDIPSQLKELQFVFAYCWEEKRSDRPELDVLEVFLDTALRG